MRTRAFLTFAVALLVVATGGCTPRRKETAGVRAFPGPGTVLWREGEHFDSAPTGLGKVVDDRVPCSGGKTLYGPALSKRGRRVTYEVLIPQAIPFARFTMRYARLHWRERMVPAVIEVEITGPNGTVRNTVKCDSTGGWGRRASEWGLTSAHMGHLAPGRYTVELTGASEDSDINMDGFFIAPQSVQIAAQELQELVALRITSAGYCGLRQHSATLRQGAGQPVTVAARRFGGEPVAVRAELGSAKLVLKGSEALKEYDSRLYAFELPPGPDGTHTLKITCAEPACAVRIPITLIGDLLGTLEDEVKAVEDFAGELKKTHEAYCMRCAADFEHMAAYLKGRGAELTASAAPPESAFKKGLAEHEGFNRPVPIVTSVRRALAQAKETMRRLNNGLDPYAGRTGDLRRAFHSKASGELKVYRAFVPASYKKAERVPFVLMLHGGGGNENYWPEMQGGVILRGLAKRGYLAVMPAYRTRAANWREDLVQLVDLARKEWPKIDPERIYCTGISMGGFGTYGMATTYPGMFTAICCVSGSGRPDTAHRLKEVPTMLIHGGADGVVPASGARNMAGKMKELGQVHELHVFDTHGHAYYPEIYLPLTLDFFDKHKPGTE